MCAQANRSVVVFTVDIFIVIRCKHFYFDRIGMAAWGNCKLRPKLQPLIITQYIYLADQLRCTQNGMNFYFSQPKHERCRMSETTLLNRLSPRWQWTYIDSELIVRFFPFARRKCPSPRLIGAHKSRSIVNGFWRKLNEFSLTQRRAEIERSWTVSIARISFGSLSSLIKRPVYACTCIFQQFNGDNCSLFCIVMPCEKHMI